MRGAWAWGMAAGILAGWGCGAGAFACSDDAQCQGGPGGGVCAQGFCAFPADDCDSMLRWGEHAGERSGDCVPAASDTDPAESTEGPADGSTTTAGSAGSTDDPPLDTSAGSEGPLPDDVEFRDDALAGEFGAGAMQDVEWAGDRLTLAPGATEGTFTSRVFDAGTFAQWLTADWLPDAPYGKPLPDGGAAEVGYRSGGVSMADNVLLLHFDGEGVWNDGDEVLDVSGARSHGVVVSNGGPVALVPGIFGTALDDHAASRISIDTATAPALAFGTADFTWSLWFRMDDPCTNNHVYMGVDDSDDNINLGPHLWLGCTDDPWTACPGRVGRRVGGVLRSQHSNQQDGGYYCSASEIGGDVWRHVAMVKQGHDTAKLHLYVDGLLEFEGEATFAAPIEYPQGPDFTIGAFSRGTYPAVGVFDEAAVWARALSGDEVAAVHQRGVTALRVLVRVCLQADCADDPPFGPALVDPPQATGPGTELEIPGLPAGRFVQYRVVMTGDGRGLAPALRAVTLRGMRI